MDLSNETLLCLALAIPLVGMVLIGLFHKWPNLREAATLLTAGLLFACVAKLYPAVTAANAEAITFKLLAVIPGVWIKFHVEPLGLVYALVASCLWMLNSIYAIGYMRGNNEPHQTRFYLCFPVAICSAIGIAFAANLFTLFIFYEVLTLSTYPLVTHKGTPDAVKAGRTYLGILLTTSVCLQLFGMLWIYALNEKLIDPAASDPGVIVQSIDFVIGGVFAHGLDTGGVTSAVVGILFFLYIYGIGKAALMPMHKWLPAAMVAPTPVSAFLHAVAVVKAGVFCVVKVTVYTFGLGTMQSIGSEWLVYVSGCTILFASMIALYQDNLKRRLAYSTISQLSYIVLGAALMNPLAIMGATLHIIMHAFGKITLFFAAGSIYTASHKTKVSELDGIGRRMPWTMAAFTIGTLSMIGVPPAAGFVSKWFLVGGAWEHFKDGGSSIFGLFSLFVIVMSTLLNAAYFLPIVYRAWFRPLSAEAEAHPHGEAPWPIVFALSCTAAGVLLLFVYPEPALKLAYALKVML